ncbi:uncharacterized protein C1orf167 homolog isoform X2 [Chelonia mydas]|uniref:uncharacterized protein C1orf167 homolog isoform X2 n=1 Tax=Chelonia mydas TaxID=8469 RepID=UPI0018A2090F|nr:uncharacterized protein C1orf167 homolog isoform X2 [Chelonia mydas]XP_043387818.1 uncharacterized protein C1orf167 homolog isoform X2 [Chelonia mydas]
MKPVCRVPRSPLNCVESMENTNRSLSSRKKENIPPLLSSCLKSEHGKVQKNVNINLYLGAGSRAEAAHRWANAAAFTVTPGWQAEQGRSAPAVKSKGPKKRDPSLIQTNLSCPSSQPFRAATNQLSSSCSQQQNNLYCRLQRGSSGKVACGNPLPPSSAPPHVDLQRRPFRFDTAGLAGSEENVSVHLPERSLQYKKKPKEGSSPWDQSSVHSSCHNLPEGGNQSNEQQVKKQQHGPFAAYDADHGNPLLASTDSLSPAVVPVIPSAGLVPHHSPMVCLSPGSSRGSVNSCCPGPALTLDELGPRSLAESLPRSVALQSVLQSSKTSASLHCSIQRLKQEAALMGIWSSLPLESRSSPLACRLCFAPEVSTPAVLSVGEDLAREQSSAKQARMKWGPPFVRDWGLGSVTGDVGDAEPTSLCHRCRNTELYAQRTKVSGGIWPETLCAGASSVYLVDTDAGSSYDWSPYLRYKSQVQHTPQKNSTFSHVKTNFPEKPLRVEESPCSVHWRKALPSGPDPDGLQLSLETQEGGAPMNVSVAVYGTPREVHLRVQSPSGGAGIGQVQQLNMSSIDVGTSEPHDKDQGESAEACDIISSAARRIAMVNNRQSVPSPSYSPFRVTARQGPGEYSLVAAAVDDTNATNEGGSEERSQEAFCMDQGLNTDWDQSEKLPAERSNRELQNCEESSQVQDRRLPRDPENNVSCLEMKERSSQLLGNRRRLARCFQAWSSHTLKKRTAARELYRQQQLRKGLGALQWAVQLRKVQMEIAQRRHSLAVLAASFHRWKSAVVKQNESLTSQQEPASLTKESPVGLVGLGRGPAVTAPVWCRLTAGSSQEAARHSRVEANLWMQLHCRQRADELCRRAQAIRDLRRLAAFRLWRLQKELLDKEEARVQEARALLEKKQLQNLFWAWRSRSLETEQILPLLTQIRRELAIRCFSAWRQFVERKALCRQNLEHHRAASLRKCFQQWVLMLQLREVDKMTAVNLFILRQRRCCGQQASSAASGPAVKEDEAQLCLAVRRSHLWKRGVSLDDLYQRMKLHRIFLLWKARLRQQQRANSFSQASEQRRLRDALRQWHQKTLQLNPLNHNLRAPPEEPLALLDSEESSLSSGFHSSALAPLVSHGSLEKESSFCDSSQNSISSLMASEDTTHLSRSVCSLQQHCCPVVPAELVGELCLQASSPPQSPRVGENPFMGDQLQALALWRPDSRIEPLTSYFAWEEMQFQGDALQGYSSGEELESPCGSLWHQADLRLLQRYFLVWSTQTQQHLKIQQHGRLVLLSRAFLGWHKWVVEDKNRKAMASRQHGLHCCQAAFDLWKRRLTQKVEADRRFRHWIRQKAADALRCWHTCWQKQCTLRDLQLHWAQHSSQGRKRTVLQAWHCQAVKWRSAACCWKRLLLRRVLVAWFQVTRRGAMQHEALTQTALARQQRSLTLCFARWRMEFLRATKWQQEERESKQQRPAWAKSFQRWRVATRGHQALHLDSMAVVKQACNYWTKAAALSQSSRQRGTLIGARKCRKMPLSWSIKPRRCRKRDLGPSTATYHRLLPSAFCRWLVIYRNQSRTQRLPVHQLLERPGVVGWAPGHAWPQEGGTELVPDEQYRKRLGMKYLRRWQCNVLLRQFRAGRRMRSLESGWLRWKDTSRTALIVRALIGQRLLEWGWRIWRRRYLQSQVAQSFLEGEDRSLLARAFGRWHQLTVARLEGRGLC